MVWDRRIIEDGRSDQGRVESFPELVVVIILVMGWW